jgi:multicomponent K+:H+ antiporter subunit G
MPSVMPPLSEILVAVLLVASGGVVLVAALGLWRLPDFFLRMHAPALASTLAAPGSSPSPPSSTSARGVRPCLHVWLIIIVLSITAPITTIVLARAALFAAAAAGSGDPCRGPPCRRCRLSGASVPNGRPFAASLAAAGVSPFERSLIGLQYAYAPVRHALRDLLEPPSGNKLAL